ncbi:DUF3306 domain-containing protein [Phaeobacter sp. PT47_59]|uniref:DUF3306 domain-containing protein n=1 Tax=Phaeobacter sp. PT47_59 TaxID=3029979 RepID=UPI0023802A11|nr:DUF3306 domain-containing protein [Phaeobacter sp. PT47_59]MDE4173409.1 DUF3306 domain-containing protein [Phaeobacter sp. PT47_59]
MSRDFWSRRKAAVEAEAEAEARAEAAAEIAEREQALEEKSDEEILAELELPDPDTLEQGDDFKIFLRDVVPARIRTRALRRLWRLNPVLANVDGLVDYGEDFTDSAMVVEGMQTAYQVGKGMTKHVEELARQAAEREKAAAAGSGSAAEMAAEDAAPALDQDEQVEEQAGEQAEALAADAAIEQEAQAAMAEDRPVPVSAPVTSVPATQVADRTDEAGDTDPLDTLPRRMRFSFDQDRADARVRA